MISYKLLAPRNAYNVEVFGDIDAGHGWVHHMVRDLMKMWPIVKKLSSKDCDVRHVRRFMVCSIKICLFCHFPLLFYFGPLHTVCKCIANCTTTWPNLGRDARAQTLIPLLLLEISPTLVESIQTLVQPTLAMPYAQLQKNHLVRLNHLNLLHWTLCSLEKVSELIEIGHVNPLSGAQPQV